MSPNKITLICLDIFCTKIKSFKINFVLYLHCLGAQYLTHSVFVNPQKVR